MTSQTATTRARTLLLASLLPSATLYAQDQNVTGNLTVQQSLEVDGNTASFGTRTSNGTVTPGYFISYNDGTPASINFSAFANSANWTWSQNATGTPRTQLRISNTNVLTLFNSSNGTEGVTLNPDGNSGIGINNPVGKLFVGPYWRNDYGSGSLYVSGAPGSPYGPYLTNDLGITYSISDSTTAGPTKPGLVLYNDDTTPGGWSPMLLFSKAETGPSSLKATMAGIAAKSPLGTGDSTNWIDGELWFYTAGAATSGLAPRMMINKEGNIGIGSTSPTEKLDVGGNIRLSGNITKSGGGTLVLPSSGTLTLPSGGGTLLSNAGPQTITGNTTVVGTTTLGGSTPAARIKVDSTTGNVGIGTDTLSAKLNVAGGVLSVYGATANAITSWAPSGSVVIPYGVAFRSANDVNNDTVGLISLGDYGGHNNAIVIGNNNTSAWPKSIQFRTSTHPASATERMRITDSGNVGINTSNPTYKLDINASTNAMALGALTDTTNQDEIARFRIGSSGEASGFIGFQRANAANSSYQFGYFPWSGFGLRQAGDSAPFFSVFSAGTINSVKDIRFGANNGPSSTVSFFNWGASTETTPVRIVNNATGAGANTSIAFASVNDVGAQYDFAKVVGLKSQGWGSGATPYGGIGVYVSNGNTTMTEAMRVTSFGNVGIGTATPSAKLDVAGDAKVQNLNVTGQLSLNGTTVAGGTTGLTFSSKVKIGNSTTAPTQYLTISDTSNLNGVGMDFRNGDGPGGSIFADNGQLYFMGPTGGIAFTINDNKVRMHGKNIELNGGRISGSGNGGGLGVTTDNKVSIGDADFTPLSRLDVAGGVAVGSYAAVSAAPDNGLIVSGDVGIGTPSPSAKLEVNGNLKVTGNVGIGTNPSEFKLHVVGDTQELLTVENSTDDPWNGFSVIRLKTPGQSFQMTVGADANPDWAGKWYVYNESNGGAGALVIDGNNQNKVGIGTLAPVSKLTVVGVTDDQNDSALDVQNSANDSLLFVRNDGNVGIGTTTPAEKLDVVGNAKISGTLFVGGEAAVTTSQLAGFATTTQLSSYQLSTGSGAGLTALNASAISTGTIPSARLPSIPLNTDATTGNLAWSRVDKTNASLADLPARNFNDLENKPTTLVGYGITDALAPATAAETESGTAANKAVTPAALKEAGYVRVNSNAQNRITTPIYIEPQGDILMGEFGDPITH